MKVLLIYPEFPSTFWSFKYALRFIGKKTSFPPLGLLTVSSMLPAAWEKRLVDLNADKLRAADLAWADCAFVSGMMVQKNSALDVMGRCRKAGLTIVGGGPMFAEDDPDFGAVDHFVLNEAEITLPPFLADLEQGRARRVYKSEERPCLEKTPVPDWGLLKLKRYGSMCIQYSRGCPHNCDFCNVTALLGRRVRTKTTAQVLAELDALYAQGWDDNVFFVDDNFIGNRRRLKNDLLPAMIAWGKHKAPPHFHTEASIEIADDPELMRLMVEAGFDRVFIGIETPDNECLAECGKGQNENRDLVADVKKIQRAGLEVQAGFIVGFDHDKPSVFERQIDFIQKTGIATAMVGMLQAPPGTRLYQRMKEAGRLLGDSSGDNVDGTTNIVPTMGLDKLQTGYRKILHHIYAPKNYYSRVKTFLKEYKGPADSAKPPPIKPRQWLALGRSIVTLGVLGRERVHFWNLLLWTRLRRPDLLPLSVTLAIYGYHFRKVCQHHVR